MLQTVMRLNGTTSGPMVLMMYENRGHRHGVDLAKESPSAALFHEFLLARRNHDPPSRHGRFFLLHCRPRQAEPGDVALAPVELVETFLLDDGCGLLR